jgi:uncharacterized protein (DUF1015 family)
MAKISPFQGIRYNQEKAGAASDLVCPPYDIISPARREELYKKSPYNVVRLEFGSENSSDTGTDNRYSRAAAFLNEWFSNDILRQDKEPTLYVYEMEFQASTQLGYAHKEARKLRGFICLVGLEDYQSGIIKPHETTLSGPKTDRLNLLRACKASFSQIYVLFSDPQKRISTILDEVTQAPDQEVVDNDNATHRIWSLTDGEQIETIMREMADKQLFIADGHHRYDTALRYRDERRKVAGKSTGEESFNYAAMFLARLEDPGLTILPAHRVLFNLQDFDAQKFEQDLDQYFDIERVTFDTTSEAKDLETLLDTMEYVSEQGHVFGMQIKGEDSYILLTLRNEAEMDSLLPDKSPAYQRLDVSILHHLVIDKLLGIKMDTHKLGLNIDYIKDAREASERVKSGSAEIAFYMNSTRVDEVKNVASAGECMPQKATYFYPKLVTGLVMHKID